jgi:hypothetical protein
MNSPNLVTEAFGWFDSRAAVKFSQESDVTTAAFYLPILPRYDFLCEGSVTHFFACFDEMSKQSEQKEREKNSYSQASRLENPEEL